jgi:aminomethyltransferase
MILNDAGGIIDDLIVWWRADDLFWVMPNAANQERVASTFAEEPDCQVEDLQTGSVFLAVQGPDAPSMVETVLGVYPGRMKNGVAQSGSVVVAGTGYTGEPGVEICADPEVGATLFKAFLDAGAVPSGLGARDTLRLEAGLSLWGEDIDETTTPLEAGLDFAVSFDHEFTGRQRLITQRDHGLERRLAGFVLEDRGIPRHGYQVRTTDGGEGTVTSGNLSPILDTGIGLAYLSPPAEVGDSIEVAIRDRWVGGRVATRPFHKSA